MLILLGCATRTGLSFTQDPSLQKDHQPNINSIAVEPISQNLSHNPLQTANVQGVALTR